MTTAIVFILLSFISSFGDTIFLAGVPLYFYQESAGALIETTYLPLAITVSIILARKLIVDLNKRHPILITAYGELIMAAIEVVLLALMAQFHSRWIILAGIVPLAITYNCYAPSKFLKLQDCFFKKDSFYLTSWQSAANRFGVLAGVGTSGLVAIKWGINGILISDAVSFFVFGSGLLVLHKVLVRANWKTVGGGQQTQAAGDEACPDNASLASISGLRILIGAFVLMSVARLYACWEQSSAVATVSKVSSIGLDQASALRAALGTLGILAAIVISRIGTKQSFQSWILSIFALTVGVGICAVFNETLAIYALFFFGGVLSCLELPISRAIYKQFEQEGGDYTRITSLDWIYGAVLQFSVLPIILAVERLGSISSARAFQLSGTGILVFGLLGGYAIYLALGGIVKCAPQDA